MEWVKLVEIKIYGKGGIFGKRVDRYRLTKIDQEAEKEEVEIGSKCGRGSVQYNGRCNNMTSSMSF